MGQQKVSAAGEVQYASRILYSTYRDDHWQIWAFDPGGSMKRPIAVQQDDFHFPAGSPSGKYISFSDSNRDILIQHEGKDELRIAGLPPTCNHPAFSPDSARVAVACYTTENRVEDSDIWIYDIFQGQARRLMRQSTLQSYPAWSPDGKQLVYTSGHRVNSTSVVESLWLVNADGTGAHALLENGSYAIEAAWSPDGEWIAFASSKSGNMDIWLVDKNGQKSKHLTSDPAYDGDPSWSPDGTKIAFSSTRSGQMEIWIMDRDGENAQQVTGFEDGVGESMQPYWQRIPEDGVQLQ